MPAPLLVNSRDGAKSAGLGFSTFMTCFCWRAKPARDRASVIVSISPRSWPARIDKPSARSERRTAHAGAPILAGLLILTEHTTASPTVRDLAT